MATGPSAQQRTGELGIAGGVLRWFLVNVGYCLLVGASLFMSSGTLRWPTAWIFLASILAVQAASAVILLRHNPGLMGERSWIHKASKNWDKFLALFISYGPLGINVVAGLDVRFGWSPPLSPLLVITASIIVGVGWLIYLWALGSNQFFSAVVRIQSERGHRVMSTGPYHFVRHPGYLAAILVYLATPIMLGSWWALGVSVMVVVATVLRTTLEDSTLKRELPGYSEYAVNTQFRLLPRIW